MSSGFGRALRAARVQCGLSQEQLADAVGLNRSHISLLERGLREPRLETLVLLSRRLGVSPAEMIEWHESPAGRTRRDRDDESEAG